MEVNMYDKEHNKEETPYLSGGYLNWIVHNKKSESRAIMVNKVLFSRPRDRKILRIH